jgi:hypothetical protein
MMADPTIRRIIWEWGVRCFGLDHMKDRKVRALRLVEEAIELCQAVEVPAEQVQRAVTMVYERPPGAAYQELGSVLLTSIVMAHCMGLDLDAVLGNEICRCLKKSPEEMRARNEEKINLGLGSRDEHAAQNGPFD